jgi:hypothetical protein
MTEAAFRPLGKLSYDSPQRSHHQTTSSSTSPSPAGAVGSSSGYNGDHLKHPHTPVELLLSQICALEVQNLKIRKLLNLLDLRGMKDRVKALENENRSLVEKLKHDLPEIIIHSKPQSDRGNGFISIDFSSDNGLEFECFGLAEIATFPDFIIENDRVQFSSPSSPAPRGTHSTSLALAPLERKMLRHYSVGSSRLSLANRFSLEWGDENQQILRAQSVDGPGGGLTNTPRQHNLEVAISSMRLSTSEPLLELEVKKNFLEFCVIGAKRSLLSGKQLPIFGPRQKAEILDNFPHQHHPFIESMADFAFPVGVALFMTSSKLYAEHRRSESCDQYNVFQFSDSFGTLTYACCLIVTETIPLDPSKSAKTIKALKYLEVLERHGNIIVRFMKRAHQKAQNYHRKVVTNNQGEVVGYMMVKKTAGMTARHSVTGSSVTAATVQPSPLKARFLQRAPLNKTASETASSTRGHNTHAFSKSSSAVVDLSSSSSSSSSVPPSPHKLNELLGSKISKFKEDVKNRMKKGVSEAPPRNGGAELPAEAILNQRPKQTNGQHHKRAGSVKAEWQYVVTQRAYCILSAQPQHALLFQVSSPSLTPTLPDRKLDSRRGGSQRAGAHGGSGKHRARDEFLCERECQEENGKDPSSSQ